MTHPHARAPHQARASLTILPAAKDESNVLYHWVSLSILYQILSLKICTSGDISGLLYSGLHPYSFSSKKGLQKKKEKPKEVKDDDIIY